MSDVVASIQSSFVSSRREWPFPNYLKLPDLRLKSMVLFPLQEIIRRKCLFWHFNSQIRRVRQGTACLKCSAIVRFVKIVGGLVFI